ncbi:MAG: hypothetical protein Q7J67_04535 [bacterium]|nr:hypothetical protein [bacterium]
MAEQKAIDKYREEFKNSSDDDLINAMHSWVPSCAQHIAAVQELESRGSSRTIEQLSTEKSTNLFTKIIFVLTVIILVLTFLQFIRGRNQLHSSDTVPVYTPGRVSNTNTTNNNSNVTK